MTDDIITLRNYLRVGAQNALCRWQLCEMTGWTREDMIYRKNREELK